MSKVTQVNQTTKDLIISECKRVIEILEDKTIDIGDTSYCGDNFKSRAELKRNMLGLRINTMRLQKEMR
jgi:hypothetical protein